MHRVSFRTGLPTFTRAILASALTALILGSAAGGAEPSEQIDAEKWIKARVATTWPEELGDRAVRLKLRISDFGEPMSQEDLRRRSLEIEGKPDHPDRFAVERRKRLDARGPDVSEIVIWLRGIKTFRSSVTSPIQGDSDLLFGTDTVASPAIRWSMSGSQGKVPVVRARLMIADPHSRAPKGYDAWVGAEASIRQYVGALLGGGLCPPSSGKVISISRDSEHWIASVDVSGAIVKFSGIIEHLNGVPLVLKCTREPTLESASIEASVFELSEWSYLPDIGKRAFAAKTLLEKTKTGQLLRRVDLLEIEPVTDEVIEAAIKLPTKGGVDFIRGEIGGMEVLDLRDDTVVRRIEKPNGAPIQVEIGMTPSGFAYWRFVGIAIIVVIACATLIVKIRSISK